MKSLFVYTLLVMCTFLMAYTADADLTSDLRAYPQADYLNGVGKAHSVSPEVLKARAEMKLTKKVFERVKGIIAANKTNKEAYDQVWEHYGLVLQGSADAKLTGLYTKTGSSYVIAYVERNALKDTYAREESALRDKINAVISRAQDADNLGDLTTAEGLYMSSHHLYEQLKEAELIQLGAIYSPSSSTSDFANLAAAADGTSKGTLLLSQKEVIDRINQIKSPTLYNLDTIADFAADQFRQQEAVHSGAVLQGTITYGGTVYSSPHSGGTASAIASRLGWSLVPPPRALRHVPSGVPSGSKPGSGTSSPPLKIYGTYWEDGDRITLRTALRDVTTGQFKASAVVRFQESRRSDSHIKIKPDGYAEAKKDRETYGGGTTSGTTGSTSKVAMSTITSGGLVVTIDTDKGPGPITLREGDIVTLYVSVNQEAYLQIVYVLQDKRRILLMDNNYHIDSSKAGMAVEIGQFECAPPFGIEELYVYAQPTPFPEFKPGETYELDGFVFLKEKKTRALRLVRPKNVLSITTTP